MDAGGVARSVDGLLAAGLGEGQLKRLLQQHIYGEKRGDVPSLGLRALRGSE